VVGVADIVPKLVVRRLLEPALRLAEPVQLQCHEDRYERLLANLTLHELDLVIADAPVPAGSSVRAYNHLLGESGVTVFGIRRLAARLRPGFPRSLDGAPMLLPLETLPVRRALNQEFETLKIRPRVVAEFEDSALLKVFGGDGLGLFVGPTVVEDEVKEQYGVEIVGRFAGVRESFYAISTERRLQNPAVLAIREAARHRIFARGQSSSASWAADRTRGPGESKKSGGTKR
jgi:LysR family transcriptional activator of nhaA